jgi:hypothetical protein
LDPRELPRPPEAARLTAGRMRTSAGLSENPPLGARETAIADTTLSSPATQSRRVSTSPPTGAGEQSARRNPTTCAALAVRSNRNRQRPTNSTPQRYRYAAQEKSPGPRCWRFKLSSCSDPAGFCSARKTPSLAAMMVRPIAENNDQRQEQARCQASQGKFAGRALALDRKAWVRGHVESLTGSAALTLMNVARRRTHNE